jgi:hypothetical protein
VTPPSGPPAAASPAARTATTASLDLFGPLH